MLPFFPGSWDLLIYSWEEKKPRVNAYISVLPLAGRLLHMGKAVALRFAGLELYEVA